MGDITPTTSGYLDFAQQFLAAFEYGDLYLRV